MLCLLTLGEWSCSGPDIPAALCSGFQQIFVTSPSTRYPCMCILSTPMLAITPAERVGKKVYVFDLMCHQCDSQPARNQQEMLMQEVG
mmetsp:Transcript_66051/g.110845  ORF Transcript_66051/g.110845 Transcript_66051/m.110845 type:complete len:88 (+) Transcript_66051:223-486(+)